MKGGLLYSLQDKKVIVSTNITFLVEDYGSVWIGHLAILISISILR